MGKGWQSVSLTASLLEGIASPRQQFATPVGAMRGSVLVMAMTTIGVRHGAVLRSGPKKVTLEQIWRRKRNDANGPKMMFAS